MFLLTSDDESLFKIPYQSIHLKRGTRLLVGTAWRRCYSNYKNKRRVDAALHALPVVKKATIKTFSTAHEKLLILNLLFTP